MANEIADRVAFFLKDHPPFHQLSYETLEEIASKVSVRYLESDEVLFQEGDTGHGCCFVLRQGSVRLTKTEEGHASLVDECEPGDILGIRSILTDNPYVLTAICQEESLVYEIQREVFFHIFDHHPSFARFFASGYAAGQAVVRDRKSDASTAFPTLREKRVNYSKEVLTCTQEVSIHEAANRMRERGVGSIIITDPEKRPLGIVTDTDLRNSVVAERRSVDEAVSSIMSSPVVTLAPGFGYSELLIQMIRQRVHHLVVTSDGSPHGEVIGIISDHDALLSQNDHPAALAKALRKSSEAREWPLLRDRAEEQVADFLQKDLSVTLISNFITAINDQLIENAIALAMDEVPEASGIPFCWLSLGSEGREEQLLRTDQDNAIIFETQDDFEAEQAIMLKLATFVNERLIEAGFVECPADIMARNPKYCQDVAGWDKYFTEWILTPEPQALMNATIFFDFRGVYGDKRLAERLHATLIERLEDQEIFLNHLAGNALRNPPPLGFFKQFLVEKSGARAEEFDIKKRAMMPLSDAARVLTLQYKQSGLQNTPARFRKIALIDKTNKALYEECAQAYEVLMKVRGKYGLKTGTSGRYVDVGAMNKLEKQMLKSAFLPIKDIQKLLEVRFQLAYFR